MQITRLMMYVLLMLVVCTTIVTALKCYDGVKSDTRSYTKKVYCSGSCVKTTQMVQGMFTHTPCPTEVNN